MRSAQDFVRIRMTVYEINFDGLVGPAHNYAGLSREDLAINPPRGGASNPRKAARQGLAKMKWLADLGVKQAIVPPQERPSLSTLRAFGFTGTDAQILQSARKHAPQLFIACSSPASMWMANAATVAPSTDTADGRVHLTPANLASHFHRSIEPPQHARTLRAIFRDPEHFIVHDPVPGSRTLGDEGAANHSRLTPSHGLRGVHLFAYSHSAFELNSGDSSAASGQALEASRAVARLQRLADSHVCYARQNPAALLAGAFHNDLVCAANENFLLHHEEAFVDTSAVISDLRRRFVRVHPGEELIAVPVPARRVSMAQALHSHLFNSQIVTLAPGRMALIAPLDCEGVPSVQTFIQELVDSDAMPISEVRYFDLRETMRHGGGPACLRLRVVLNEEQLGALPPGIFLNEPLYVRLNAWIRKHYRDKLTTSDLFDPLLLEESRRALDELTGILGLGSIYSFQRV